MITVVVTINILISVILLYVAWRVWLLKRSFTNLKNALNTASRNSHAVLSTTTNFLSARQIVIKNLRQRNQGLESQFQKSTQALSLLLIVSRFWRRRGQ